MDDQSRCCVTSFQGVPSAEVQQPSKRHTRTNQLAGQLERIHGTPPQVKPGPLEPAVTYGKSGIDAFRPRIPPGTLICAQRRFSLLGQHEMSRRIHEDLSHYNGTDDVDRRDRLRTGLPFTRGGGEGGILTHDGRHVVLPRTFLVNFSASGPLSAAYYQFSEKDH
jgi:hypothetical protein